jgi:hypothetical protein
MGKEILVRNTKNKNRTEESILGEAITCFIDGKEIEAKSFDNYKDETIPIMTRLSKDAVALLDHLAERWRTTRSGLACEILDEIILIMFRQVYKEKTEDEFVQFLDELTAKFKNKKKGSKRKKE